jgi:hypothetical protein
MDCRDKPGKDNGWVGSNVACYNAVELRDAHPIVSYGKRQMPRNKGHSCVLRSWAPDRPVSTSPVS